MIRVQGAILQKVKLTLLGTAKTGAEWLPEMNVNESRALTLGCFICCGLQKKEALDRKLYKNVHICVDGLTKQAEMYMNSLIVWKFVGCLHD